MATRVDPGWYVACEAWMASRNIDPDLNNEVTGHAFVALLEDAFLAGVKFASN